MERSHPEVLAKALFLEDWAWHNNISWLNRYKLFQKGKILALPMTEICEQLSARQGRGLKLKTETWQSFLTRARAYSEAGLNLCYQGHDAWPVYLNSIPDPPLWLWYKGSAPSLLNGRSTAAVVGARKVLPYSTYLTQKIVGILVERGHPVISGLAIGVDGLAHKTCLARQGLTAAILPCGLDSCYPPSHQELLKEICCQGGFVASEFPPSYPIRRENFHYRNRLISGLGLSVFIIQAGVRSGSLITGRLAAEQGRDVYVAPASLEFEAYRGSLRLIADGARIMDSYDLLNELIPEGSARLRAYGKIQDINLLRDWTEASWSSNEREETRAKIQAKPTVENCKLPSADRAILLAIQSGLDSVEKLISIEELENAEVLRRVASLESQGYLQRSRGNIILTEDAVSCIYYKV